MSWGKNKAGLAAGALYLALFGTAACGARGYRFDDAARDGGYVMNGPGEEAQMEGRQFRIQINSRPKAAGGGRVPFMIGNPEENGFEVQVEIRLEETGERIFVSRILKPGERQAYGSLEKELPPGNYEAEAVFIMLEEGGGEIGRVETGIEVGVEGE